MNHDANISAVRAKLGARIRELRRARHISQKSLALMIGMDRTYLVSVEKGRRNVGFDNLVKIAGGLGVTLSELTEGVDTLAPQGTVTYYVAQFGDSVQHPRR